MTKHLEQCKKVESSANNENGCIGKAAGEAYTKEGQCAFKEATKNNCNPKDNCLPDLTLHHDNSTVENTTTTNTTNTNDHSTVGNSNIGNNSTVENGNNNIGSNNEITTTTNNTTNNYAESPDLTNTLHHMDQTLTNLDQELSQNGQNNGCNEIFVVGQSQNSNGSALNNIFNSNSDGLTNSSNPLSFLDNLLMGGLNNGSTDNSSSSANDNSNTASNETGDQNPFPNPIQMLDPRNVFAALDPRNVAQHLGLPTPENGNQGFPFPPNPFENSNQGFPFPPNPFENSNQGPPNPLEMANPANLLSALDPRNVAQKLGLPTPPSPGDILHSIFG